MVAEGIIDGKVVCSTKRMPSRRSTKLRLYVDSLGKQLVANGSDFIVVVAEVTDDSGNVRRLAKENVVFSVEGEGEIIGDASINANPRTVEFGSAPVLIRSTRTAGKIKIKAHVEFEGTHAPTPAEIEIESIPADIPFCYVEDASSVVSNVGKINDNKSLRLSDDEKQKLLDEVERQQSEFGTVK
jgi:beta-galactosidase